MIESNGECAGIIRFPLKAQNRAQCTGPSGTEPANLQYQPGLFQLFQRTLDGSGTAGHAAFNSAMGKGKNSIPLVFSAPPAKVAPNRRVYMTFAVLLVRDRSMEA